MGKRLTVLIGALYLLNGAVMWAAPSIWYARTPGVTMTGAYNMHFIMDIGLIYAVSGVALALGALRGNAVALLFGAAWPALHAALHAWMWLARGMALDSVALANLFGIQLPAWITLFFAVRFAQKET